MTAHDWMQACCDLLDGSVTIGAKLYPATWAILMVSKIFKAV